MLSKSRILTVLLIFGMFAAAARADPPDTTVLEQFILHVNKWPKGEAPYTFDKSAYNGDLAKLPIGVFDSGIGGLTVLEAILTQDSFNNDNLRPGPDGLPDFVDERFIYFGDQANMPYGNYAAQGKENFLRELILKDAVFLLGKRSFSSPTAREPRFDKPPVKAILIACNTATAYGLDDVRQAVQAWGIPVIVVGVVESGARGVNELISSADKPKTIAVMATVGTCASMAYPKAIGRAVGIAGKRIPKVIQQGSAALAGAIEGDPSMINRGDESQLEVIRQYVRQDVANLVESYRQAGTTEPIEMVVLGCTHFPLVQDEIVNAFEHLRNSDPGDDGTHPYKHLIAERLQLINPAELVAKELYLRLAADRMRIVGDQLPMLQKDAFFLSVPSPEVLPSARTSNGDLSVAYKYGRETDRLHIEDTRAVPMQVNYLAESSKKLIQNRLPEVWKRLDVSDVE
jgi:glutamate racemase